jgi:transposase-like protein
MKIQTFIMLLAFATFSQASVIYKSIDEHGNVVFSDRPKTNAQSHEKLELDEPAKLDQTQSQTQLKQLDEENHTIRQRFREKHQALEQIDQKIKQDYAALTIAEKAMQQAQVNWQEAMRNLQRGGTDYEKKRALLLEKTYEQTKSAYNQAQQDLARAQSERNSLR